MREVPSVIGPVGPGSPFGQGTCLRHAPAVKVLSESLLREGGQLSVPVLGDVAICKLFVSLWDSRAPLSTSGGPCCSSRGTSPDRSYVNKTPLLS